MSVYQFVLVVDREPTEEQIDAIFEFEDEPAVISSPREGIGEVEFEREASTLADAVASAVRDLESVGLRPVRVKDQDLVTLADIAERVGRSREAVRLWSVGKVGPGGFPPPVTPGDAGTTFYRWSEVAPWLGERMGIEVEDAEPVLAAANLALQLRALAPRVRQMDVIRGLLAA